MIGRSALALLVLGACAHQPAPAPWPIDASDAAPTPTPTPTPVPEDDAGPTACAMACSALRDAGCPEGVASTCLATLMTADDTREVRTPAGHPLTCAAVAVVHSANDARVLGITCAGGH